ncbi:MAG: glycerophosphoryl diester phosphodiesterase, partial [Kiritimatiellia bacterium]
DRQALKRLIDLGVDAVITDYPDLAVQLRDTAESARV